MKLNLGKLLHAVGVVIAAAPVAISAVKPVVDEIKGKKKSPGNTAK